MFKNCWWIVLVVFFGFISSVGEGVVQAAVPPATVLRPVVSTADHSKFKDLDKKFVSGPEVTKACLKCHNLAAAQVHDTIHWTWAGRKNDKKGEGKAKILNNF